MRREVEREFWREVAKGLLPEDAAAVVGVSPAAGTRWFRQGGGMPAIELSPLTGRYLSFAEREELANLDATERSGAVAERLKEADGHCGAGPHEDPCAVADALDGLVRGYEVFHDA